MAQFSSRTTIDRPLAVVDAVNTASPATYWVTVDHLNRPFRMTNAARASVWDAVWLPWGGVHSITGSAALDARFPGQWFQTETGLHYNWHRQYDPTLGRYTQPDPLGFVDGPSVFGYARGAAQMAADFDGRQGIFTDDPNPTPTKELICSNLRILTVLICKIIPNRCYIEDSCSVLETKIKRKKDCIFAQQVLSSTCYSDNRNHPNRTEENDNGIMRCKEMLKAKNCYSCPQP